MSETIVIVGAGHAAGQAVTTLRQKKFTGRIIMIGEEAHPPYQRPPLSKKFLAGALDEKRLHFRPEKFYPDQNIEMILSCRVEAIDPEHKSVRLSDGTAMNYDKLLLTTGSRVRKLAIPGSDLPNIHYLRNIDDVVRIQKHFHEGARLVIVGAGYIGLEVAATAVKRGIKVTVLETANRAMNRVVAPEISSYFQSRHKQAGVKIEFSRMVQEFRGKDAVEDVVCAGGHVTPADACIVGIGIIPNSELAEAAGLKCGDGIIVDDYARTSVPDIYAAGDCTQHPNALLGIRVRLESVHNALEQAKTAASAMCGDLQAYSQIPWFWSEQYDVKLQIAGLSNGYDQLVVRGDPDSHSFAAFYLKGGKLLAVDAINSPREFMLGKKLIAAQASFDPAKLADGSIDFKSLATAALEAASQESAG